MPEIEHILEQIVSDNIAGLPTTAEKWVRKSLRQIVKELDQQSHHVSRTTVGRLLKKLKYGLVSNRKSLTGADHPDQIGALSQGPDYSGQLSGHPALGHHLLPDTNPVRHDLE